MEEVPRRTSLAPLASPLLCTLFSRGGSKRVFRIPGEGGDHFHCTVEPSPSHIRCGFGNAQTSDEQKSPQNLLHEPPCPDNVFLLPSPFSPFFLFPPLFLFPLLFPFSLFLPLFSPFFHSPFFHSPFSLLRASPGPCPSPLALPPRPSPSLPPSSSLPSSPSLPPSSSPPSSPSSFSLPSSLPLTLPSASFHAGPAHTETVMERPQSRCRLRSPINI